MPKLAISQRAGVSRNSVKSYIRQFIAMDRTLEELLSLKDADLEKLFLSRQFKEPEQRYVELALRFPDIDKALKKKGNTLYRLWQEYLKEHPDGFKHTQFNKYYRQWSARTNSTMHIEHKVGDKMYVDYAGEKLQIVDPATDWIHFLFRDIRPNGFLNRDAEIFNVFGEKVGATNIPRNTETFDVNVSNLSSGLYLLVIREGQKMKYPNPGIDYCNIKSSMDELQIQIFNSSGVLYSSSGLQEGNNLIHTVSWPTGIYLYRIYNSRQQLIQTGKWIRTFCKKT